MNNVVVELEKLNNTETAPESQRYIYARILCREVANKAMPNKRARCCRVFQLPTPDGFRLPMKKETTNDKFNQIPESEYRAHHVQWRELFEREPDWFLFGIGISGKGGCKNLSKTQKGICSRNVDSRRDADGNGQQIDASLFFARSGSDRDVRANSRRGAVPCFHLGRFGRQTIDQSPSRANERHSHGNSAVKTGMATDYVLFCGRTVRAGNRQNHGTLQGYDPQRTRQNQSVRLSDSNSRKGRSAQATFPAVRSVKQCGRLSNFRANGLIVRNRATKSKILNVLCTTFTNWSKKTSDYFLSLTRPAAVEAAGLCVFERR